MYRPAMMFRSLRTVSRQLRVHVVSASSLRLSSSAMFSSVDEQEQESIRIQASNASQRSMATTDPVEQRITTKISPSSLPVVQQLVARVNGWNDIIRMTEKGERAISLDPLPMISTETYENNTKQTARWLQDILKNRTSLGVQLYTGFEAFYDVHFEALANMAVRGMVPMVFSPLVKSTREYLLDKARYDSMETTTGLDVDKVIVHLGSSHAMDRLLFQEDANGRLQAAWTAGRLIIMSPELFVVDHCVYRAGLSRLMQLIVTEGEEHFKSPQLHCHSRSTMNLSLRRVQPCDYTLLDEEIAAAQRRVDVATTMEQVFTELYYLVTKYVERGQLNSPCYWDSGWESFHLYKSVSQALAARDDSMRLPWTRVGLINARNAAIGDSLHAFYATVPEAFPLVVCGDTAALLAGGISMINIHTRNRFGVVIIPNNRGMAIEDVISKRSVDGHKYQYDYVKLDRKRDIFTLGQLKDAVKNDVMAELRDHLWGVSASRAEAIVLNIDVQSLRKENADESPTDAVLSGRSFLDQDFGERFRHLEKPRKSLEAIVNVLYRELNVGVTTDSARMPVKIQGCSAIEFMEIVSQLSITMRDKLKFLPTPTDLLATRTLLPSLVEARMRTVDSSVTVSNFTNSNGNFSVFISNSIFGLDGLNNLISTHLEYGTGTLVHLAYDAADTVTHYSLVGQVHRNFGIRPSTILPQLYRNHQGYEGQIVFVRNSEEGSADRIQSAIRDPSVKAILVDMGAPNLTSGFTTE